MRQALHNQWYIDTILNQEALPELKKLHYDL